MPIVHDRHNRDEPFDRTVIASLRERADAHLSDPFGIVDTRINWLWYARMVATLEEVVELRKKEKERNEQHNG